MATRERETNVKKERNTEGERNIYREKERDRETERESRKVEMEWRRVQHLTLPAAAVPAKLDVGARTRVNKCIESVCVCEPLLY